MCVYVRERAYVWQCVHIYICAKVIDNSMYTYIYKKNICAWTSM